jgi:hypothetical protein
MTQAPGELPHRERPRRGAASAMATSAAVLLGGVLVWALLPVFVPDIETAVRAGLAVIAAATAALADPPPRIEVDPSMLRAGWRRIPIADVRQAVTDRRPHRLESDAVPPSHVRWRVGTLLARDGVHVDAVTAEGLPYEVWIGSDDPGSLAAAIEQARHTVEARVSTEGAGGYRGPRGAIWGLAAPFLVVGFALTWLVATAVPVAGRLAASVVLIALVAVPALRRVEISRERLRSGPVDVPTDRVVAARAAARGELPPHWQQLPRRNRAMTAWGPPHVIVLVTDPAGGDAEARLAATHLLALPRPVDLRAVLPHGVVDRRLPPVSDTAPPT